MNIVIDGTTLALTEHGFLLDQYAWNETVAEKLATSIGITLSPAHWEIVHFIRNYHDSYHHLPNTRLFTKAIAKSLGIDKGNSLYLYKLFPENPLRHACLIAGLPKPPSCL